MGKCIPAWCSYCGLAFADSGGHAPRHCRFAPPRCTNCDQYGHRESECCAFHTPGYVTPHRRLQAPSPHSGNILRVEDRPESDLASESSWARTVREEVEGEPNTPGRQTALEAVGLPGQARIDLMRATVPHRTRGLLTDDGGNPSEVPRLSPPMVVRTAAQLGLTMRPSGLPVGLCPTTKVWLLQNDELYHLYRACRALRVPRAMYYCSHQEMQLSSTTPRRLCPICLDELARTNNNALNALEGQRE